MVTHVFDNSNLSQEIFAIDTWRAAISSLGHGRKHMLTILPTIWRPGFSHVLLLGNVFHVIGAYKGTSLMRNSHSVELLQWKRGSNGYLKLPGNGKINYVTLRTLNKNCSTLASDKRPSLLCSY